ncbi:MAG: JAB domain-containing protein, partial [Bacteroidota bacterium]
IKSDLADLPHEEFWMILLKRNHEVIKKEIISRGGVSGTLIDAKIIFKRALEESASALILAHNHPSGNLKASQEDILLTKKLKDAGKTLDISILDHVIVTDMDYLSFSDEGLLKSF